MCRAAHTIKNPTPKTACRVKSMAGRPFLLSRIAGLSGGVALLDEVELGGTGVSPVSSFVRGIELPEPNTSMTSE